MYVINFINQIQREFNIQVYEGEVSAEEANDIAEDLSKEFPGTVVSVETLIQLDHSKETMEELLKGFLKYRLN